MFRLYLYARVKFVNFLRPLLDKGLTDINKIVKSLHELSSSMWRPCRDPGDAYKKYREGKKKLPHHSPSRGEARVRGHRGLRRFCPMKRTGKLEPNIGNEMQIYYKRIKIT